MGWGKRPAPQSGRPVRRGKLRGKELVSVEYLFVDEHRIESAQPAAAGPTGRAAVGAKGDSPRQEQLQRFRLWYTAQADTVIGRDNPPSKVHESHICYAESAKADRRTICAIGIVHVEGGQVRDEWKTLIDPEDWFDPWNVEGVVKGSPTLSSRLRGSVLVSHSSFDRTAFEQATDYYELEQLQVTWLDSPNWFEVLRA